MFDKFKSFGGQGGLSATNQTDDQRKSFDRKSDNTSGIGGFNTAPLVASPSPPPFYSKFASVSLHLGDRIRILQLPVEQLNDIHNCIIQTWPYGIQVQRQYDDAWEFKMRGNPWLPHGDDAIHGRRLTRSILSTLFSRGWVLYVTTDISRNPSDHDSLFFRHQNPAPWPCEWFSITFSRGDRVRLIDAPQSVINDAIAAVRPEMQSHAPYLLPGVYEIKLNGFPFSHGSGETMVSRNICLKLFAVLEQNGYTVYASMDQKYDNDHGQETDTWHILKPVGWTRGAPVYHR